MKILKWNKDFITGIDIIDFQHRVLISKLNELYTYINEVGNCICLSQMLDELFEYSIYNFSTEESYFDYFTYKKRENHINEHRIFKEEILNFKKNLKNDKLMIDYDLLIFLTEWAINHMLETDLEFVREFQSSLNQQ